MLGEASIDRLHFHIELKDPPALQEKVIIVIDKMLPGKLENGIENEDIYPIMHFLGKIKLNIIDNVTLVYEIRWNKIKFDNRLWMLNNSLLLLFMHNMFTWTTCIFIKT